jgi:NCS1 family nucleobase:cation symporter-1
MDSTSLPKEMKPDPNAGLYNLDIAPTPPSERTWSTYNYIALWFSMSMEVTTFMLASSLIAGGMNWKEAITVILIGNLIVLIPMLLNAHAGVKYGIPFPVLVRASFGTRGANIPAILRALVACGWFGIQTWIGGQSIDAMVGILWPDSTHSSATLWLCFCIFWLLNMVVIWCGLKSIRFLQAVSAPFLLTMSLALLVFMVHKAGGLGPIFSAPSHFATNGAFFHFFFLALTGMVGNWATLSLNIPDFTRYSKSQSSQVVGQAFGLPIAMVLYSFIGIVCTSASTLVFGEPIWNPIVLLSRFHQPAFVLLALVSILIATLNVNIGANVVSPSNDFSNLDPKRISFRTGGLITGFLGLCLRPWRLMASHTDYIGWLVAYSGLLGPVAGIMVSDYFFIRHTNLDLPGLYRWDGPYKYSRGFNIRAIISLCIGVCSSQIGLVVPILRPLYDYAWFVGFFVSSGLYILLMKTVTNQPALSSRSQS